MKNNLHKFNYFLVLAILACCMHLKASAYPGHEGETGADYFAEVKKHKGDTYEITANNEHIGHFIVKSVRGKSGNIILKLEQTFHLDPEVEKTVSGVLTLGNMLKYEVVANGKTYLLVIDFQNLDSGSNTGYRISYDTEHEDRIMSFETINVEKASD